MRLIPLTMVIAVLALALVAGCGDSKAPATATVSTGQKICPVEGDPINPNIYVDYNNRRVYFCCALCPPKFNADPEKYIKILDEQMKGGAEKAAATVTVPAGKIAYWTCTMHPEVKADKPGTCPKCNMALVPVPEKPAETPSAPAK